MRIDHLKNKNLPGFAAVILVALCGCLFSGIVVAAQLDLKQAETMIRDGKAAAAYALLEPFEAEQAGDPVFDYLLASAALNSGQPSKASFIYERILAVQPDYVGVRADMGRAYFAMENYARAKIEFETVIAFQSTPADLKSAAQQYLSAIEQRQQGKKTVAIGYVEFGYGRDSNVNSATSSNPVDVNGFPFFLNAQNQRASARYFQVGLGGEINHQLNENFGLYGGADTRGRVYNEHSVSNYDTVDGRAGLSYSSGANLIRGGVTAGRYILDGNGTRDNYGVTADWRRAINNSNQLLVSGAYSENKYIEPGSNVNDFNLSTLNVGWTKAFGTAGAINATATAGNEHAVNTRDDGNRKFYGVHLTLQVAISEKVSAFLVAGTQKSNYETVNPSFQLLRGDRLDDATVGLSWRFADRWTLRPLVSLIRNTSNIGLDEFKRADASVTVRRDFY
jgi:tetratricopeptide (TPR) repeat protein